MPWLSPGLGPCQRHWLAATLANYYIVAYITTSSARGAQLALPKTDRPVGKSRRLAERITSRRTTSALPPISIKPPNLTAGDWAIEVSSWARASGGVSDPAVK
ncbi:hypothetical protein BX600DRAFT_441873 [Xylariales sp. PMI_506]|nr:hypothetical protein BX600DRAFT_441873 [Xylariales sp. PMI_506]